MGTVTVYTAAHMKAIEDATVTSMAVNGAGHLVVTRHDGSSFDAGDVSVWLPGRIKALNNLGAGNDPNAFLQNGWYAGTNWANSLLGYTFGVVEVLAYDANYIVQNFYLASNPARRFMRSMVGGTWTNWVEKDIDAVSATTTIRGQVILATDAEAVTGTDSAKAVTPHALSAGATAIASALIATTIPLISGIHGTITGIGATGGIQVLLSDGVTTVYATVSPDAKQLASNNVLLDKYPGGGYVITASQPLAGFIAQPFDYINPKIAWYQTQTTDTNIYNPPWAYRSPGCWVSLTGMMRVQSAIAPGDILVTLPPAFRPLQNKLMLGLLNGSSYITVNIAPNGNVTLFNGAMTAGYWFTFEGMQFNNNPSLARTPLVLANGFQPYSATDYTPQYVADDGYGRHFVEGLVKQVGAVGSSANPIALTSANPGLGSGGGLGTLHKTVSLTSGWKRLNLGYAVTGVNLSQEATTADTGIGLESWTPTNTLYGTWTGLTFAGASNGNYGSSWRPCKEGLYGDGMYGLTGLALINTAGIIAGLHPGYAPKYGILQQQEAAGVGNGRLDVLSGGAAQGQTGQLSFVAGSGSYCGLEEYSWIPGQWDSALHR